MNFLGFGRKKTTRKTKPILKVTGNKDEKLNRSYLLRSFHKQYHFFSRLYEENFEKIKKNNKLGNPYKIASTIASLSK